MSLYSFMEKEEYEFVQPVQCYCFAVAVMEWI